MPELTATKKFDLEQLRIAGDFFKDLKAVAAELPFDLIPEKPVKGEAVAVADLSLTKLGELTQGEEFIWNHFIEHANLEATWMSTIHAIGVTLLLMFRHDPAWDLSQTLQLSQSQVATLYEFYVAEKDDKKPVVEAEPETITEERPVRPKKQPKTSGRKSTGDLKTLSPVSETSAVSDSAVAVVA